MAEKSKKRWRDLSPRQQRTIVVAGLVEIVVTTFAIRDLVQRPKDQVVGPKLLWFAAFAVQPVGPFAYFAFGRRQLEDDEDDEAGDDAIEE
jgi:hypothetical protein